MREKIHDISYLLFVIGSLGDIICSHWVDNDALLVISRAILVIGLILNIFSDTNPKKRLIRVALILAVFLAIVFAFEYLGK